MADMASIKFYKNKYVYPEYSDSIEAIGESIPCTPVGINIKSGSIRVEINLADIFKCNYIRLRREQVNIYAWIEDIEFLNDLVYIIHYKVDAWRTYKDRIKLGTQFIARSPKGTNKHDDLLQSSHATPVTRSHKFGLGRLSRTLIVQMRTVDGARKGLSSTPVQPSPYTFWACTYNPTNWQMTPAIVELVGVLNEIAETNIVTMYSIPFMNTSKLPEEVLPVVGGDVTKNIEGWRLIANTDNIDELLTRRIRIPLDAYVEPDFYRVDHTASVVIPEAGIIDIPDQLLAKGNLWIRQHVDIFSGASNYMIEDDDENHFTQSVRGNSVSSIPVLSDAMETYLSQNQSALTTSLIGDVATTGIGVAMSATGGGAMAGVPIAVSGINSMYSKGATSQDMKNMNNVGNPPAFLGTALTGQFNSTFWLVTTQTRVDNSSIVHRDFGYPLNMVDNLTLPSSGYIKTEGCNVSSDGTVPRWAIEEINSNFNTGMLIH